MINNRIGSVVCILTLLIIGTVLFASEKSLVPSKISKYQGVQGRIDWGFGKVHLDLYSKPGKAGKPDFTFYGGKLSDRNGNVICETIGKGPQCWKDQIDLINETDCDFSPWVPFYETKKTKTGTFYRTRVLGKDVWASPENTSNIKSIQSILLETRNLMFTRTPDLIEIYPKLKSQGTPLNKAVPVPSKPYTSSIEGNNASKLSINKFVEKDGVILAEVEYDLYLYKDKTYKETTHQTGSGYIKLWGADDWPNIWMDPACY